MGGAIDAVGAGAQIDAVQVELENLLLVQRFLQRRRVEQFHIFARIGALGIEKDDLRGLLRDGRAARHDMTGAEILDRRAQEPAHRNAFVAVEAAVFHGDEGGRQVSRHLVEMQAVAHDGAAMADFVAFLVEEGEGHGPIDGVEVLAHVDLRREPDQNVRDEPDEEQRREDDRAHDGERAPMPVRPSAEMRQDIPRWYCPACKRLILELCGRFRTIGTFSAEGGGLSRSVLCGVTQSLPEIAVMWSLILLRVRDDVIVNDRSLIIRRASGSCNEVSRDCPARDGDAKPQSRTPDVKGPRPEVEPLTKSQTRMGADLEHDFGSDFLDASRNCPHSSVPLPVAVSASGGCAFYYACFHRYVHGASSFDFDRQVLRPICRGSRSSPAKTSDPLSGAGLEDGDVAGWQSDFPKSIFGAVCRRRTHIGGRRSVIASPARPYTEYR